MNPTDWAKIEDSLYDYLDDLPRKRRPMPTDPMDFLMGGGSTPPPADDPDDPPVITARYDGMCSACEEFHIVAGVTEIRADGYGGWEDVECAW